MLSIEFLLLAANFLLFTLGAVALGMQINLRDQNRKIRDEIAPMAAALIITKFGQDCRPPDSV